MAIGIVIINVIIITLIAAKVTIGKTIITSFMRIVFQKVFVNFFSKKV